MKFDSLGLTFENEIEEIAAGDLYKICMEIREELARSYNVYRGENENYKGLCDIAIKMLSDKLKEFSKEYHTTVKFTTIHGEQKHSPRLNSCLWPIQHTWAVVEILGVSMYVDPTSSQFKQLYYFIPDFYISTRKPKWYYSDGDNPLWNNKIINKLNDRIKIPVKIKENDGNVTKFKEGIIEYLQYQVWGKISDLLNKQERPNITKL